MSNPEFIVYTGPMFSSKTTKLLSSVERFKYQHKTVLLAKPKMDDRYSVASIRSHSGWEMEAWTVETGQDILDRIASDGSPNYDVVAVDESFMIPGAADALIWLFRQGLTVVTSTLDISFSGKVFGELRDMLPWATTIEKCSAVCTVCGADAYYTHKKLASESEIQVGGAELYEPRCFSHHVAINERDR